jgi:hypothetical protein
MTYKHHAYDHRRGAYECQVMNLIIFPVNLSRRSLLNIINVSELPSRK